MATPPENPDGYVGNLTPSQEEKLSQFWKIFMQSWDSSIPGSDPARKSSISSTGSKSHRRLFSLGRAPTQATEEETAAIPANLLSTLKSLDAGPSELKAINTLLKKLPGNQMRPAFLKLLKQDHPDALALRFIRAEKWNVPKAWIKFVRTLNWRVNEYKIDEEVLLKGEEYHLEKSRLKENSTEKKDGEGFVLQLRTGKGYHHGADKWGRPITVVRVRLHNPSEQTQKALFDYVIHCFEITRLLQVPPVETMAIVFDLTTFSLSNWDFPPVKFIVDSFQEYYPESLGALIFYNAPWIFAGFWKIIHGILDPVVASKVHFINGAKHLEQLVPESQILKEIGGQEDWEYNYIEPTPGENDRLKDTVKRDAIMAERKKLGDELFQLTAEMLSDSKSESLQSRRDEVITKLSEGYWQLDPYVRARTLLDRTGVIKENGTVDFYPSRTAKAQPQVDEKAKVMTEHVDNAQVTPVAA